MFTLSVSDECEPGNDAEMWGWWWLKWWMFVGCVCQAVIAVHWGAALQCPDPVYCCIQTRCRGQCNGCPVCGPYFIVSSSSYSRTGLPRSPSSPSLQACLGNSSSALTLHSHVSTLEESSNTSGTLIHFFSMMIHYCSYNITLWFRRSPVTTFVC